MTKRILCGLTLLLLMIGWQTSAVAVENLYRQVTDGVIDCTDDRPQWQDVGMCDLLAIGGNSTLTSPTTVRVVQNSASSGTATAHAVVARHYRVNRLLVHCHRHTVSGYIYLIRCLRL